MSSFFKSSGKLEAKLDDNKKLVPPPVKRPSAVRQALTDLTNKVTSGAGGAAGGGVAKPVSKPQLSKHSSSSLLVSGSNSNLAAAPAARLALAGASSSNLAPRPSASQASSSNLLGRRPSISALPPSAAAPVSSAPLSVSASASSSISSSVSLAPAPLPVGQIDKKSMPLVDLDAEVKMEDEQDNSYEHPQEDAIEERMRGVDQLDSDDQSNPQMVSELISDIMAYLKRSEARRAASPHYMSKQTDINAKMREILVDWLVAVHLKFLLKRETLYLTINVIDRFLERRAVKRTRLQLVGCTAMLIASKYEEIYAPEVRDFVYISDRAYTHEQILAMEGIILNTLKFNLTIPSANRFAERYIKVAKHSLLDQKMFDSLPSTLSSSSSSSSSSSPAATASSPSSTPAHVVLTDEEKEKSFEHTVYYLIELQLQKYQMLKYLPSMIASSAVYIAMRTLAATHSSAPSSPSSSSSLLSSSPSSSLAGSPAAVASSGPSVWDNKMITHTEFTERALQACVADILGVVTQKDPKYCAVRRKYASTKYLAVSKNKIWTLEGLVLPVSS